MTPPAPRPPGPVPESGSAESATDGGDQALGPLNKNLLAKIRLISRRPPGRSLQLFASRLPARRTHQDLVRHTDRPEPTKNHPQGVACCPLCGSALSISQEPDSLRIV